MYSNYIHNSSYCLQCSSGKRFKPGLSSSERHMRKLRKILISCKCCVKKRGKICKKVMGDTSKDYKLTLADIDDNMLNDMINFTKKTLYGTLNGEETSDYTFEKITSSIEQIRNYLNLHLQKK